MSGSSESVRWNACVHRLDLGLNSHPKEFWRNGVRTHVNSKGKMPSTGCAEADGTHDSAPRRTAGPTHYPLSYSGHQIVHSICMEYGVLLRFIGLIRLTLISSCSLKVQKVKQQQQQTKKKITIWLWVHRSYKYCSCLPLPFCSHSSP